MEGTHELAATQAPAQPDDDWLTPHDDTWRERQRVADRRALATLGVTVVSVVWVLVGIGTSQRHSAWEELAVLPAGLALVGLRVLRPREAEASDNTWQVLGDGFVVFLACALGLTAKLAYPAHMLCGDFGWLLIAARHLSYLRPVPGVGRPVWATAFPWVMGTCVAIGVAALLANRDWRTPYLLPSWLLLPAAVLHYLARPRVGETDTRAPGEPARARPAILWLALLTLWSLVIAEFAVRWHIAERDWLLLHSADCVECD